MNYYFSSWASTGVGLQQVDMKRSFFCFRVGIGGMFYFLPDCMQPFILSQAVVLSISLHCSGSSHYSGIPWKVGFSSLNRLPRSQGTMCMGGMWRASEFLKLFLHQFQSLCVSSALFTPAGICPDTWVQGQGGLWEVAQSNGGNNQHNFSCTQAFLPFAVTSWGESLGCRSQLCKSLLLIWYRCLSASHLGWSGRALGGWGWGC